MDQPDDLKLIGRRREPENRGFTLVEIMVVCAIIALLIAILVPSLNQAREQSKIGTCGANAKQVGHMVSLYQTEYAGAVPTLLNYDANGDKYKAIARTCWLSVALRKYSQGTSRLQGEFNPQSRWSDRVRDNYQRGFADSAGNEHPPALDEFYVCPFVRGKGPQERMEGRVVIKGKAIPDGKTYTTFWWEGWYESYHTFLWQNVVRNRVVQRNSINLHPNDPFGNPATVGAGDGRPKYSVITFSRARTHLGDEYNPANVDTQYPVPGAVPVANPLIWDRHRTWGDDDVKRYEGGSLSSMTMIYCNQGSHMGFDNSIRSPNSHVTSAGPGTNAVFADSHVEWVKGTQIGWP